MSERKHKYSVILNNYNKPSDRFLASGYGDPAKQMGIFEMIELAGKQGVVEGLELIYVDSDEPGAWIGIGQANKNEIKSAMDDNGLEIVGVLPNIWGDWRQSLGTIGAKNPVVRRESVDLCKRAMDLAADVGCEYIGIWPGHDGYDYYFEADYPNMWEWWVEGVQEIADHNPQIRVGLEAKPTEPRGYCFLSTNPKTLMLIRDIARDNVGVCLDIGHSLYAHENLGEVVALTQHDGNKLFHCHMNDNYNDSDLDMIFGSIHTLEFIEMFYWLRKTGYDHFLSIDLFAYRVDPPPAIVNGIEWMKTFDGFIDKVGVEKLDELLANGDPNVTTRFFREKIFGK